MWKSKHTIDELHQLQALSLNEKVERTKARIRQWVEHWGLDHVVVSFSGGKDSSVLLDIARSMYPEMKAVFLDTSLEFPELREFVSTFDNVEYLKPKMNFRQVIEKYGYPVISKEVSECVMGAKIYLTKLMEEQTILRAEQSRAEQSRAELPYAQFYRKLCGTGEYARNCAPESNSGGQKHIYSYECDRILGTIQEYKDSQVARGGDNKFRKLCGLGLYSKDIGEQRRWVRRLSSEVGTSDGDIRKSESDKGEYP